MSLFKSITDALINGSKYRIKYGSNKKDGSHDHRVNKGKDRTPSQKMGDKKHSKD
jgi:hypothetical protein